MRAPSQYPPIFLLTGPPGAGKSTLSRVLLQRFELGLHLPVDDLRELVVSGIAHPIPELSQECLLQFRLARTSAAQTAKLYAEAGFAVVLDDIISAQEVEAWLEPLVGYPLHKVLLLPRLEVAQKRNASRTNKSFDPAVLAGPIQSIHGWMAEQTLGSDWLVLDSSELTPEQTVEAIVSRFGNQQDQTPI